MNILHIEDYDKEKGVDYAGLMRGLLKGHAYTNVETLSDLKKEQVHAYDFFIIDGQFPKDRLSKPEVGMCPLAVGFLISRGIQKEHMIIWSNSTRTHQFAAESHLLCFSKKEMKIEDYTKKGVNPKFLAKNADPDLIASLINLRATKRSGFKAQSSKTSRRQ